MEQFSTLRIKTVDDLARSTLGRLSQMNLNCSDSLAKLYEAIEVMTKILNFNFYSMCFLFILF